MVRHLASFSGLTLGLVIISLACAAPAQDAPAGSADAQATAVRRTAVAQVQRIIANPSTPTPLPEPTATPRPTCPNAIWWTEAPAHIGEARTIEGTLVGSRPVAAGGALLEIGQPYPDPTGLAVLLASGDASSLSGKTVCVAGRLSLTEGRPTLQVQNAAAVTVVASPPTE